MNKGLKLGNGAVVQAQMIVWNKDKLGDAMSNLTDYEERQVHLKLVEKKTPASTKNYETLIAVEEITQNSFSTKIPLTCPETANAIITAFTNEADVELGYYVYHAHQTHGGSEPVAFSGYDFAQSYSDILSLVGSEIFVINGKGTGFHKRKPEPRQYPQEVGLQPELPKRRAYIDHRGKTPDRLNLNCSLKKQFIVPPESGWEEHTWYLVDVSFRGVNPIHRVLFFSGFLNDKDNGPGGYNQLYSPNYDKDASYNIKDVVYLSVAKKLASEDEWGV